MGQNQALPGAQKEPEHGLRRRACGLVLTERSGMPSPCSAWNLLPHLPQVLMLVTAQEPGLSQPQSRETSRGLLQMEPTASECQPQAGK